MALEIDLLAVGDGIKGGDAILIRYGDLEHGLDRQFVILIDGGYKKTAPKIKRMLDEYYKCKNSSGKYIIDLMILSHPDLDHVGGLVELSNDPEIEVKEVLMQKPWDVVDINDFEDGRMTPNSLRNRLKEAFDQVEELNDIHKGKQIIDSIPFSFERKGAQITILAPSEELYRKMLLACPKTPDAKMYEEKAQKIFCQKKEEEKFDNSKPVEWNFDEETSEINETSLVILFEYEGHRILLTGDAGKFDLTEAIDTADINEIDLRSIDIIKMPHHGSRKNVNPEIMDRIGNKGTRCYISCAEGDEGHHPSKRLVNMLKQKGFTVLTTGGSHLHKGFGAPERKDYDKATPLDYYSTMEKL